MQEFILKERLFGLRGVLFGSELAKTTEPCISSCLKDRFHARFEFSELMPGHHIGPTQKILRTPSATRQRQDAEPSQKVILKKTASELRAQTSRSDFILQWFLGFPFKCNFGCKTRRSRQSGNVQIPEDLKGTGYPVSSAHPTSAVVEPETFS